MTYFEPLEMSPENRDLLLQWIKDEGLDPHDIVAFTKFSVHNGRVAGFKFARTPEGKAIAHNKVFVKVPFNLPQQHPLPEWV